MVYLEKDLKCLLKDLTFFIDEDLSCHIATLCLILLAWVISIL